MGIYIYIYIDPFSTNPGLIGSPVAVPWSVWERLQSWNGQLRVSRDQDHPGPTADEGVKVHLTRPMYTCLQTAGCPDHPPKRSKKYFK